MYGSLNENRVISNVDSPIFADRKHRKSSYSILGLLLVFLSSTLSFGAFLANYHTNTLSMTENIENKFSVAIVNEYSDLKYSLFPYPFLVDALLLEPYRTSSLQLMSQVPFNDCSYGWKLNGINTLDEIELTGIFDETCNSNIEAQITGEYVLSIYKSTQNATFSVYSSTVWVKYVRRELQSLNDEDREEFLDAMHTLWTTNTRDGKNIYGDNYKSLYYLATIHNDGGGNSACDEMHGSSGFVNNHVMLGAYLEQSLRLVNPKVSLHYMEYSKYFSSDAFSNHIINPMDGGNWTEILSEKYFGSNDPYTGRIIDGRWANSLVPFMDDDFFEREGIDKETTFFPAEETSWLKKSNAHIRSPYGLLRSPWNYNPANYTLRYNNANRLNFQDVTKRFYRPFAGSTCDDYEVFIRNNVVGNPLSDYLVQAETNVHGKIHFTFGGAGGDLCYEKDQLLQTKYGIDDDGIALLTTAAQSFFKGYTERLFSHGVDTDWTPLNCSVNFYEYATDIAAAPGTPTGPYCQCNDYYFESEDNLSELIFLFFDGYIHEADDNAYDTLGELPYEQRKEAMKLICSRFQFDGDMAGSGAATDPLFWVAHGAVERLFQRVIFEDVLTDKEYVTSTTETVCSGHATDGTKYWLKGFYFEDKSIDASNVTNAELIAILDPSGDLYPQYIDFVYEDSAWSWCEESELWFDF